MNVHVHQSPLELPSRQRDEVRDRSKLLFGNRDRLEVMLAIASSSDGFVNASDLQREIDIVQNRIRNQLVVLARVGLLSRYPEGGGKNWYQRVDSPIWEASVRLYEDWTK